MRLKQSIKYNSIKSNEDVDRLLSELPQNLSIELSLFIHESTYTKVEFLKNNDSEAFLAWICPLLKAVVYD